MKFRREFRRASVYILTLFILLAATVTVAQTTQDAHSESRPATEATPAAARQGPVIQAADPLGTIYFFANTQAYEAKGQFRKWRFMRAAIPGGDLTKGVIEIEIKLASLEVDNAKTEKPEPGLTTHLKSADFFDIEKFPKAFLVLQNAKPTGEDAEGRQQYTAEGTLTIREVTQPVTVSFTLLSTKPMKVKGTATVPRAEFGVGVPHDPENPNSPVADVRVEFETLIPVRVLPDMEEIEEETQRMLEGARMEGEKAPPAEN